MDVSLILNTLVSSKTRHVSDVQAGDYEWTTHLHASSSKAPHTYEGNKGIANSDLQDKLPPCLKQAGLPFAAASQVVLNNLRTAFGSPGATLAKFESLLGAKEGGGHESMSSLEEAKEIGSFFWELERLVLEASKGTKGKALCDFPLNLPGYQDSSKMHPTVAFFRTNSGVCSKYFKKIRPKLFNALLPFSTDKEIIARGFQILENVSEALIIDPQAVEGPNLNRFDIWTQQNSIAYVESVCVSIVKAMVRQCDQDGISGLKKHVASLILNSEKISESYPFTASDVERRLVWMDAAALMCKGDLETACRMFVLALHMFENVFPNEKPGPGNPMRSQWNDFYRVAAHRKKPPTHTHTNNEKKNFSEFVTGNLSCHFFSLSAIEYSGEAAMECAAALEDWEAVDKLQVSFEGEKEARGGEKIKQGSAGGSSCCCPSHVEL